MKSVVIRETLTSNGEVCDLEYMGVRGKFVRKIADARTFTNGGHAKNAIRFAAERYEYHLDLAARFGHKYRAARWRVQPVKLSLVGAGPSELYEP